jgi:flagellar M-ring protein FliF
MNARLQQLWTQLGAFFVGLPPARRVVILTVAGVSLVGVLGLAWWVQRPLMRPLFTNLSTEDASAIVQALRAEKVVFEIDDGGHAILVPAERLYELRLALAGRGLPAGGGVGFEIFDKQTLGQTDFLQRLNYQRALQGELGRTVAGLGGVESARVHLALPERSLFVTEDRKPSASVVVKLAPGRTLSHGQIDGIVHLVAASVEGLATDAVTVVDEGGRILTPDTRDAEAGGAAGGVLEYKRNVERATEERVESMLGAVVGREKAIARVAATLDFARVERTEETYDPDKAAVRTAHTTKEQTSGARAGAGGPPGVQSNLTNEPGAAEGGAAKSERKDESSSYEISKVVSHTIAPVGVVKLLSVAVLIDGTYKEEGGKRTFTPRPQEELDRLKELVKSAIGLDEGRGDKIEFASVAFQSEPPGVSEGALGVVWRWAPSVLPRLLGVVFAIAMLLWVVRPLILSLGTRRDNGGGRPGGVRGLTGMDAAMVELTGHNLALAQQNPERAARLVRQWLLEGADSAPRES